MSRFTETSNPLFTNAEMAPSGGIDHLESSTVDGAVNKTYVLLAILLMTTYVSYMMPSSLFMIGGAIGGLIVFFAVMYKPQYAPIGAPIYAGLEGLFVGSVSAMYASMYEGIVVQAISLTIATLFMMLIIYKTGMIKVTEKFKTGVLMATGAIFLVYMASFIGSFVGFSVPYIHDSTPMGIGITVVIIGVAAMNLLIDFDMFEKAEENKAPAYMEWFCAMALIVTLVWLYIEFLRLLSKLKD